MEAERWEQVERIYHDAISRPPEARAAFLRQECGTDLALMREVESLLASGANHATFLETPVLEEAAARLAPCAAILSPGRRLGRYDVIELVAVGGMGEVYRARDRVLERDVAVKVVRDAPSTSGRPSDALRREGQAAARLSHPNICAVHEVDQFDGCPYLVMEYVPGRTLARLLAEAPLPVERVLRYGIAVADALAHAHERGVLHKDLKAANVIVADDDRVKVVDFGIARRLDPAAVEALSRGGASLISGLAGTPAYMAPEVLCGTLADVRSDVWALGVLLHEMAAGELPFAGHTEYELAGAILHDAPRPLPADVPPGLASVIARCLAKDAAGRFQRASEVRDALEAVYASGAYGPLTPLRRRQEVPPPPLSRPSVRRPRPTIGYVAAAVAVVLACVAVAWWIVERRRGPAAPGERPGLPMVAVMPFQIVDGGPDHRHFSIGIADAIITRMAAVRSLRVRPTASVAHYGSRPVDATVLAGDLAVTQVLQGTIRPTTEEYEFRVQLVSAADGSTLWGDKFTVPGGSLMSVEERVADRLVRALDIALSDRERERLARPPTHSAAAYQEYLKGRTALLTIGEPAVDTAIAAFERALQLDPAYAQAQAGLAVALVRRPWYAGSQDESERRYQTAVRAARRASQLDPLLPQAHEALAAAYRFAEFEWDTVISESLRALELGPSLDLPHYNLASAFYHLGLFDLADRAAERGLAANPRTRHEAIRNQGRSALYDGRFETAARLLAEAESGSDDGPRWMLGEAWHYLGENARSVALLERVENSPQHVMRSRASASLAAVLAARGDRAAAERRLRTLTAETVHDHHVSHRIATAYAQLGRTEEAVRWLRQAARSGFPCAAWFEKDPLFDPVRAHPSFQQLLAELRPSADLLRARYARLMDVPF